MADRTDHFGAELFRDLQIWQQMLWEQSPGSSLERNSPPIGSFTQVAEFSRCKLVQREIVGNLHDPYAKFFRQFDQRNRR